MAMLDKAKIIARRANPEELARGRKKTRSRMLAAYLITFLLALGAIWTEWHWQFLLTALMTFVVAVGYSVVYGVFTDESERRRLEELR